ncbi:family 16 glycosylhydrolase [Streptomyces sp. NPDC004752]
MLGALGAGAAGLVTAAAVPAEAQSAPLAAKRPRAGKHVLPLSDPNNHAWTLNPDLSDEFDGTSLDTTKWYDHHTYWQGRAPSYFTPSALTVGGGSLTIAFNNLNHLNNPAFDGPFSTGGSFNGWIPYAGTPSVVYDNQILSNFALVLDASTGVYQFAQPLDVGREYTLTAYARAADGGKALLEVSAFDDADTVIQKTTTSGSYEMLTINFSTRVLGSAKVVLANANSTGSVRFTLVAMVATDPAVPTGSFYSTGCVQSKVRGGYGYYECRAKIAKASHTSAFWFQNPSPWQEVDVTQDIGAAVADPAADRKMDIGWTDGGSVGGQLFYDTGVVKADDFHVYGFDWAADGLKIYFDGTQVWSLAATTFDDPMYMFLDCEAFLWNGFPTEAQLPSQYQVDYVRAWTK